MRSTIWIGGLAGALLLAGAAGAQTTNCTSASTTLFSCTFASPSTGCSPTASNSAFTTQDILDAVQLCDSSITEDTPLLVAAGGGAGGDSTEGGIRGLGGVAIIATTIADLNNAYGGSDAQYCYGIGGNASHNDGEGAGGASSILRTCVNESQTATTGVLVIGGGGGGGGSLNGGGGGLAISTTSGSCPPSCAPGSTTNGAGDSGTRGVGGGGGGGGSGVGGEGRDGGGDGGTGVGGTGGAASVNGGGFIQGQPGVNAGTGQGGEGGFDAGGGGGYGGGGSATGAGGGGGSFAAQSSVPFTYDLVSEPSGDGWLTFVFNDVNIPAFTPSGTFDCEGLPGQNLTVLTNGGYNLLWQTDGNLVLYNPANAPVFASNTSSFTEGASTLCFQTDGNLVVYAGGEGVDPIWASGTADTEVASGDGGEFLVLFQDGTLQILSATNTVLWGGNPPPSG
jgi:hypothetical protein